MRLNQERGRSQKLTQNPDPRPPSEGRCASPPMAGPPRLRPYTPPILTSSKQRGGMSPALLELLDGCLCLEAHRRPSIQAIAASRWFAAEPQPAPTGADACAGLSASRRAALQSDLECSEVFERKAPATACGLARRGLAVGIESRGVVPISPDLPVTPLPALDAPVAAPPGSPAAKQAGEAAAGPSGLVGRLPSGDPHGSPRPQAEREFRAPRREWDGRAAKYETERPGPW